MDGDEDMSAPWHDPAYRTQMTEGRVRAGNPNWRGDAISYNGAHRRIRRDRGPASAQACVSCGGPARDWALREDVPSLPSAEGCYSPDPAAYMPLCRRCHIRYDKGMGGGCAA